MSSHDMLGRLSGCGAPVGERTGEHGMEMCHASRQPTPLDVGGECLRRSKHEWTSEWARGCMQ